MIWDPVWGELVQVGKFDEVDRLVVVDVEGKYNVEDS